MRVSTCPNHQRYLARARKLGDSGRPALRHSGSSHEVANRTQAFAHGAIGAVHDLVVGAGLIEELDSRLELLKFHRPYHESHHVLNIAYTVICGGQTLDHLELLRNDEFISVRLGSRPARIRQLRGISAVVLSQQMSKH